MRSGVATALLLTVLLAPGKALAAASSALYDAHCALCHQRAAAGAPGQFPRLAGRVAAIAANPDGRAYLVGVVRNGLSGSLEVDGVVFTGLMPAFPQLQSDELASIFNYLTTLRSTPREKPHRFTDAEVASLSKRMLSAQQLLAERESLTSARVIP
jgi:mono/diheme cytochrome c family protein